MNEIEIVPGDWLVDNDPRTEIGGRKRRLRVMEVLPNGVVARTPTDRIVAILRHRIHTDGKPRRSGYTWEPQA